MGTTGSIASWGESDSTPGMQHDMAFNTIERCEYIAPLGLPVVPEV